MPLCALAVHQLRFYVVFGSHAPAVLAREGHGYLSLAEPAALLLAALGLGWFVGRLALKIAGRAQAPRSAPGAVVRSWLVCALVLFAIYCAQELLEGFFSPGHPAGIAGVLGQGGWTAAPISLLVGAALAMTLRLAHRLLEAADPPGRALWRSAKSIGISPPEPGAEDWRLDPQSGVTAGRAPPRAPCPH
ncbi:MAG TPA: hypothetical protein VIJ20_14100 [Solirubrobacteraceae bacterium]